jgi:hypothetical protein
MAVDPTARPPQKWKRADAEVLDLVFEELPVGRMPAEVLEQELNLPRGQHPVDLDSRPRGHVGAPPVLFALLDVHRRDGAPPRLARGPGARELDPVLHRPRTDIRGILVEEVAAARIQAEHILDVVGEQEIDLLVAEVDPVGLRPQEELVAEVTALVEHAKHRGEVVVADREREPDEIVGVDQVERARTEVEDRKDAGEQTDLPPRAPDPVAIEGKALAEAHRGGVAELGIIEVVLPGRREVRPARVGDQGLEEHAAWKHAGLPLGRDAWRLGTAALGGAAAVKRRARARRRARPGSVRAGPRHGSSAVARSEAARLMTPF